MPIVCIFNNHLENKASVYIPELATVKGNRKQILLQLNLNLTMYQDFEQPVS